jgi:hypothetical protein
MKKVFSASLCYRGAHGGGLLLTDELIAFRTNKLQLPPEMKRIQIPLQDIDAIVKCRSLQIFPAIMIQNKSGRSYKFIIFSREKFLKCAELASKQSM